MERGSHVVWCQRMRPASCHGKKRVKVSKERVAVRLPFCYTINYLDLHLNRRNGAVLCLVKKGSAEHPHRGNAVNVIAQKWRALRNEHTLFYSYRWVTWAIAGLTLLLPGLAPAQIARNVWLLVLTAVLNIFATGLAESYVRIAQRRPLLLALDVMLSVALVWLSGGHTLPFLPYALGALLLPALISGWRGALIAGLSFVALDQAALIAASSEIAASTTFPGLVARSLTPLGVALLFALLAVVRRRSAAAAQAPALTMPPATLVTDRDNATQDLDGGAFPRFPNLTGTAERGREPVAADTSVAAQLTAIRTTAEQGSQQMRRALYDITPGLDVELSVALDQLSGNFSRHNDIDLRMQLIGTAHPLSKAQHTTLLKLAQEALLNVQQHARAHSAIVTLRYEPRAITLTIQDDGVGLLDGTYERPGVHALRAMHYRLTELDGHLEVFEGDSGGVTVRGTLPLDDHS